MSAWGYRAAMAGSLGLLCFCAGTAVGHAHGMRVTEPSARARAAKVSGANTVLGQGDSRIRVAVYSADRIYRLHGYAGYQIDVQFAPGERFVGAGVGDVKGIGFASAANHLFIKPRAARVATNLTVLTNRRTYLFDYMASPGPPGHDDPDVIYALRFEYPVVAIRRSAVTRRHARIEGDLLAAERAGPRNYDYWYCGAPSLKPRAAWDNGIETYIVFGSGAELPAVFLRNSDGSESLVNFDMRGADMVIHRVARRFVVRRGGLAGCIVNRAFTGSGRRLVSGTLSPDVRRVTRTRDSQGAGARHARVRSGARP